MLSHDGQAAARLAKENCPLLPGLPSKACFLQSRNVKRSCTNTPLDIRPPLEMEWKAHWEERVLRPSLHAEKSPHSLFPRVLREVEYGNRQLRVTWYLIAPSCSWLSYLHDGKGCNPPPNNPGFSPATPLSRRFLPSSSLAQPLERTLECFPCLCLRLFPIAFSPTTL